MTPVILSSSTLNGDPVVNLGDEDLGTLKDIMIDVAAGMVAYAVIARGGFGGVGAKLFAVPWQLLEVDGENHRLILDVSQELLDDSPGFDPDNWPSFADTGWQDEIHSHFDVLPYWDRPDDPARLDT